ncbi:unnamed protein product, partial [Phaeothamnion confervicola]
MSKMRRRDYDACTSICADALAKNERDQQAIWYLMCRATTEREYVDDLDMEEEGVAELLLDEHATADAPRPGTSISRPLTSANGPAQSIRPVTSSGRPLTGFSRPGTSSRPTTGGQAMDVTTAMRGACPGTSRPMTALGREVRLGTASMALTPGGPFINTDRIDFRRYAFRPPLAMVLEEYLLHVERSPRKALELAAEATAACEYKDWWWKARLGKAYYKLGMLRDAERQFKSSLKEQDMVATHLELVKVYLRLDLPNTALDLLVKASERHPGESRLLLATARVHDLLNDGVAAALHYRRVLAADPSCVEAIACLAANHFYGDQPEVALRFYRRLLQMGANSTELWCNLGLSCFYASQHDMAISCLERALSMASDDTAGDIWYNIGHVAIGIGDLGLAYQAFKIAVSVDPNNAESFCNLAVLELRKRNVDAARACLKTAQRLASHLYEPFYN